MRNIFGHLNGATVCMFRNSSSSFAEYLGGRMVSWPAGWWAAGRAGQPSGQRGGPLASPLVGGLPRRLGCRLAGWLPGRAASPGAKRGLEAPLLEGTQQKIPCDQFLADHG